MNESSSDISPKAYPAHPQVAVGAVVFHENRILLVKRGRPPAQGLWAIPGGSIELGETLQEAAEREVREETGIIVKAREPMFTFDLVDRDQEGRVRFHYVVVDLSADYVEGTPKAGDDALEARWVAPKELKDLHMVGKTRQLLKKLFGFD